jgi:hypothetical protein
MWDENGPRGGVDKRCQVALHAEGAGAVVVTSVASDWRAALNDALARRALPAAPVARQRHRRMRQRLPEPV